MSRIGIVILLTGLVFLGNYAYHRLMDVLGAGGKLALLTLAGGALVGLGAWLEKKSESLRNYGRVLLAGGGATLYYTAYAAHFVETLQVIENALLGGTLLLALAGGILWYAQHRRSEATALLTVLLSYYTSAINAIGAFTLFSNLLLTGVAVFFLVRHRWTKLPAVCLVATYGSYGFWRFHQFVESGTISAFGMGPAFLVSYWVIFTAAAFLAARDAWKTVERTGFLTLNNGVFFAFAAHHFAVHRPGAFGSFALVFGIVLLGLAALAARRYAEEPAMDGAYLAQGLAMVTVGFVAKLTGPQLAIVLALECGALLACARWRHGWLYQGAAAMCALGAFMIALVQIEMGAASPRALGGTVAALLLANVWWVKWLRGEWTKEQFTPAALGFAVLGLLLAGSVLSREVAPLWLPAAFAGAAVVGLLALRVDLREIAWPAQGFVLWGALLATAACLQATPTPWWSPLPVVAVALGLMHWWQYRHPEVDPAVRTSVQLVFAAAATLVGAVWLHAFAQGDAWLIATSGIALGTLFYGLATRAWPLALTGQAFNAFAVLAFLIGLGNGHPHWFAALAPVLSIACTRGLLALAATSRWTAPSPHWGFAEVSQAYRVIGAVMLALWAFEYVPADLRVTYFAVFGAVQILVGSFWQLRGRILTGWLYAAVALVLLWVGVWHQQTVSDLIAILLVLTAIRLGTRHAGAAALPSPAPEALVIATIASAWLWVTQWTVDHGVRDQLTTAWTLLALAWLGAGLGLRERLYRLGGFALLALALARLFFTDVWGFDPLYRIISFLVLGAVLLVLSFVYHRFAELMKRWL